MRYLTSRFSCKFLSRWVIYYSLWTLVSHDSVLFCLNALFSFVFMLLFFILQTRGHLAAKLDPLSIVTAHTPTEAVLRNHKLGNDEHAHNM